MSYRQLGRSGLRVSPLCLGTMMFGGPASEAHALAIVEAAREAGVNFIDTANAYTGGESERITGKGIAADRERWVLATKFTQPFGKGPNDRGGARQAVLKAFDDSRRRLGTDYVDIYYIHVDDPTTPLEETVDVLALLITRGHVHHIGISNFSGFRISEIVHLCKQRGLQIPVVCQPNYSAVSRTIESEVLPACAFHGVGVATYSPLARGVLTGKYRPGEAPPLGSRAARQDRRLLQAEWRPESIALAEKFAARARQRNMSPVQFATLWCLNNQLVTSVVAGPRTPEQWRDYLAIQDHEWQAEDEAFVNDLVAPGHTSTPNFVDPAYPVRGRVPRSA
ncbi:MAG: aldo/keto reductase [Alphaproteobacteria bacterium]|nr:aldo/keto reductase [Alphaproteobacteria bacterium]